MNTLTYKLILVGDGGVGKTTYCSSLRNSGFEKKYVATLGALVHPYVFSVKKSSGEDINITYNLWDTAGQERFSGIKEGYYIQGHCAIVMFDLTNNVSLHNVAKWIVGVMKVLGDVPIVVVGNKYDEPSALPQKYLDRYFNTIKSTVASHFVDKGYDGSNINLSIISAKGNYDLFAPLLNLGRRLLGYNIVLDVPNFA